MTPEGDTKKELKKQLDAWGWYHFWAVQTGYGKATLDCLACVRTTEAWREQPGEFWGIECKKEGITEPTARQAEIMRRMRAAGARTWVVTTEEGRLKWIEITE